MNLRRIASGIKQELFPRPAVRAWRTACRQAQRRPRFTAGSIRLLNLDIEYSDLPTLCPQWHDLFVRQTLRFQCPHPAPRILDCGANLGLASLYFKRLYPQARITAYEADPSIHALLRHNLDRNGAADVESVAAAVWVEEGTISFRCEGADSGTIDSLAGSLRGPTRTVPCRRLRDLLRQEPIDLLKLDIEGAELPVLQDCLEELETVPILLLDVHEFQPGQRATPQILDLLARAGFTYSPDELNPLPWRPPTAGETSAFPGTALCWALLVRAWHDRPETNHSHTE